MTTMFATKSLIAVIVSISLPLIFNINNLGTAIAGLVGGASAATVVNKSSSSKKKNEELDSSVNNAESLVVDTENIDEEAAITLQNALPQDTQSHSNRVIILLEKKGIEVIQHRQILDSDKLLDSIACYLGKHYAVLEKVHSKIKASIINKTGFTYNLYGKSQQEIQSCTFYCNKLYRAKILHHYYYDKRKKIIRGIAQWCNEITQFLNGGWFERATLGQIKEKIAECQDLEFLVNPHIIFTNGDRFELDILFLVDKQLFWVECKTGKHSNYKDCLPKYCLHRQRLGVAKENAFLVGLGLSEEIVSRWMNLWDITVVNQDGLLEKIHLNKDISY